MGKPAMKARRSDAEKNERDRVRNRKKYLARKIREGKPLTAVEETELRSFPRAPEQETSAVDSDPPPAQDEPAPPGVAGDEPAPSSPPPPPPPRAAPEPPPHVDTAPRAGGDWRAAYRKKVGRQGACESAAGLYCTGLARLVAWIAEDGTTPLVSLEMLKEEIYPAVVLVADQLMPAKLEMSPELTTAVGSGLIVGQAAVVKLRRGKKAAPAAAKSPLRSVPQPSEQAAPPPSTPPRPAEVPVSEPTVAAPIAPEPFIPKATDVF